MQVVEPAAGSAGNPPSKAQHKQKIVRINEYNATG